MATVSTSHQAGIPSSSISGTTDKNEVVFLEPAIISLPPNIQEQLSELEHQFKEGDLTEKGYHKRRSLILIPYLIPYHDPKEVQKNDGNVIEPELELLPKPVVEELKKLQEELGNEEITEKGFQKRRALILAPYMLKEPPRNELPVNIQQEYANLELEYKEGDITDKGFRKKKIKLLKPYLVAVNPTTYTELKQKKNAGAEGSKGKQLEKVVMGIQSVMNDGQKLFKCGVCGEVFKQAHSFSGHCRIHRAERVKDFKCNICNAAYSTKSHLKFHMYKHTGNFPFTCRYCGKGFAGRSQHKSHESRHTGESPYPCRQCGARFWKKENYDLHVQTSCLHNKNWTSETNVTSASTENRKATWSPTSSQEQAENNIESRKMSWTTASAPEQAENMENRKIPWSPTASEQDPEIIEQRKIPWTPTATEQHIDNAETRRNAWPTGMMEQHENRKSLHDYKNNSQHCTESFDTGEEMSGEMHIQDLSNINMTTINLADVSSPAGTSNTRENLLTTPTLGVGNSMDAKHHDMALSGVRLNIDPRIGKFNKTSGTYSVLS